MKKLVIASMLFMTASTFTIQSAAEDFPKKEELCSYTINNGGNKMRYCRNRALSSSNDDVRRGVIVIPGSESPAHTYYYDRLLPIAKEEGVLERTNIIVPQFLEDDNNGDSVLKQLDLPADYLYWFGGWRQGNTANNGDNLSSYAMVDFIVKKLIEYNKNIEHIAIVGHSAGGQFVNRYAAGSDIQTYAASKGVTMSYGVSAAGSFVYFDESRPESEAAKNCAGFNKYKYGLDDLNSYMNDSSDPELKRRAVTRNIDYLVGSKDTDLDTNCAISVQGKDRVTRMWNYRGHLNDTRKKLENLCLAASIIAGRSSKNCATTYKAGYSFWEVSDVGHSSDKLFKSDVGRKILFHWE